MYLHPTVARLDLSALHRDLLARSPLAPPRLAGVAGRLAAAVGSWRPAAGHEPAPTRLLSTGSVEVWLLGWSPGQSLAAHDHGGACGAFTVVDGLLVEDCLDQTIWTTGRRTGFRAGAGTAFGPEHVHVLANPGPEPATSVHAWSPQVRRRRSAAGPARYRIGSTR